MKMNRRSFVQGAAMLGMALVAAPCVGVAAAEQSSEQEIVLQVFAANSLQKAMPLVQELYTEATGVKFADTQFKASGDLVEQLTAGAAADVLITASKGTMDKAEEASLVEGETRADMFENDLVVVGAQGAGVEFGGMEDLLDDAVTAIAIGEPSSVPAGKYACQALYCAGLYSDESGANGEFDPQIADKVILADKVGTCASYVSTGDATVGFVYSSDVYRYEGIEIVYTVSPEDHKPIVYPGAVCSSSANAEVAANFLHFCMNDPDALDVWSEYGFEVVVPAAETAGAYADGTYEAAKNGIGGKVPVTVTVEGGVITSVEVGDNAETAGIGTKAIEALPAAIVEANGVEGVDVVSGATVTSNAILKGVEEALAAAQA